MKIELRNVKYAAFASQETACFEAAVYIDGKREGSARNDGHGGMTFVEPRALCERLDAYGATLPPMEDYPDMKHTHDSVVDDLLSEYLTQRDLTRLLKGSVAIYRDGRIYKTKHHPTLQWNTPEALASTLTKTKGEKILNALPFDEALALYKTI